MWVYVIPILTVLLVGAVYLYGLIRIMNAPTRPPEGGENSGPAVDRHRRTTPPPPDADLADDIEDMIYLDDLYHHTFDDELH